MNKVFRLSINFSRFIRGVSSGTKFSFSGFHPIHKGFPCPDRFNPEKHFFCGGLFFTHCFCQAIFTVPAGRFHTGGSNRSASPFECCGQFAASPRGASLHANQCSDWIALTESGESRIAAGANLQIQPVLTIGII